MRTALPGHGNTAHSAAQPLRLWFGLPVAIGQASLDFSLNSVYLTLRVASEIPVGHPSLKK